MSERHKSLPAASAAVVVGLALTGLWITLIGSAVFSVLWQLADAMM